MHIAILFYADTLALTSEARNIQGRAIANNSWLNAALQILQPEHKVTIICGSPMEREYIEEWLQETNVTIITMHELCFGAENNQDELNFDVLHVQGPDMYRGLYIRNQILKKAIPVSGLTHSLGHAPFQEWLVLNVLHGIQDFDCLICTTETAAKVILAQVNHASTTIDKKQLKLPTSVIPLGFSAQEMLANRRVVDTQNRSDANKPTIELLWFGRLSYSTKTDLLPLLIAVREVQQETTKKIHLTIAGAESNEQYEQILESALVEFEMTNSVTIKVSPSESEKQKLFADADIFIGLSDNIQETFGLTIVESMSAGLPIIASDWDGYRCLIKHGENGLLIPTLAAPDLPSIHKASALQSDGVRHLYFSQSTATDIEALTAAIVRLVEDDRLRVAMGNKSFEEARNYQWEKILPQYVKLWETMSEKTRDTKWQPPAASPLNYSESFASYPTRILSADNKLNITWRGRHVLTGEFPMRMYTSMEGILDTQLMGKILSAINIQRSVLQVCTDCDGYNPDITIYHIMWLYKYGLLSIK